MLLSTVEVKSFEDAQRVVQWYSGRWGIEVYHRTLKSGCRIKDRQFGRADQIETCLGVDMIVAWRIYHLTMLGREVPELPYRCFSRISNGRRFAATSKKLQFRPQSHLLCVKRYTWLGASGHLERKSDGFPGTQTLWRGLQRLDTATEMYAIFTKQEYPRPIQSGP